MVATEYEGTVPGSEQRNQKKGEPNMPRKNISISIITLLIALSLFFFFPQREKKVKIVTSSGEILGEAKVIRPKVNKANIEVAGSVLSEPKFYQYTLPLKIKTVYKSMEEAGNKTPEELMISIRSANTQEWLDYNESDGQGIKLTPEQFAKRRALDPDSNYYELMHKLEFEYKGIPVAVIKYRLIYDSLRRGEIVAWLEKINGRWVTGATTLETKRLEAALRSLESGYLKAMFTGKKSENETVDQLARKNVKNVAFNINLFK